MRSPPLISVVRSDYIPPIGICQPLFALSFKKTSVSGKNHLSLMTGESWLKKETHKTNRHRNNERPAVILSAGAAGGIAAESGPPAGRISSIVPPRFVCGQQTLKQQAPRCHSERWRGLVAYCKTQDASGKNLLRMATQEDTNCLQQTQRMRKRTQTEEIPRRGGRSACPPARNDSEGWAIKSLLSAEWRDGRGKTLCRGGRFRCTTARNDSWAKPHLIRSFRPTAPHPPQAVPLPLFKGKLRRSDHEVRPGETGDGLCSAPEKTATVREISFFCIPFVFVLTRRVSIHIMSGKRPERGRQKRRIP